MRYFYHENASQPVRVLGRDIQFDQIDRIAGRIVGIHAAEGAEAEALAQLVARRVAITEIPQSEYDALVLKKKAVSTSLSYGSWRTSSRPVVQPGNGPQLPLAPKQGVVSAERPTDKPADTPENRLKDYLKVERAAPPTPFITDDRRVGESKRRTKQAA